MLEFLRCGNLGLWGALIEIPNVHCYSVYRANWVIKQGGGSGGSPPGNFSFCDTLLCNLGAGLLTAHSKNRGPSIVSGTLVCCTSNSYEIVCYAKRKSQGGSGGSPPGKF